MKLFYSPIHGFIHKVLVAAHESGLDDRIERVAVYPMQPGNDISAINPLAKVPTLTLDDGRSLYGSQVISEYIDSFNTTAPLFPAGGDARWDALRRLSLADQTFEVNVQVVLAKPKRDQDAFDWGWPKIMRALDQMERDAAAGFEGFDIGQASTLQTLSYFGRSCGQTGGYSVFGQGPYDWADERTALKAWYDDAVQRPSVRAHFGQDYIGPSGPEHVAAAIAAVAAAQ